MLKVLKSGLYATVQDLGRFGYASSGVPVSGVMDQYSTRLANLLLNNDENDAVIEIAFGGTAFQFLKDTSICLSGADLNVQLNGEKLSTNHAIKVTANSVLTFSKPAYGFRCYLAVKGGFLNKKVVASRSYFKEITKNYVLKKDDELLYSEVNRTQKEGLATIKVNKEHFDSHVLDVFKGPEYELLTAHQETTLNKIKFTVSKEHNRMGYKLDETIQNTMNSMLTSSTFPGTVQLTPSGKLIILMRDCGVTGGYPRVLQLTDAAINKLAQKSAGGWFNFRIVAI
jgi:biotin-dependent carboxylase-like uncharacterized protein